MGILKESKKIRKPCLLFREILQKTLRFYDRLREFKFLRYVIRHCTVSYCQYVKNKTLMYLIKHTLLFLKFGFLVISWIFRRTVIKNIYWMYCVIAWSRARGESSQSAFHVWLMIWDDRTGLGSFLFIRIYFIGIMRLKVGKF